MYQRFFGLQQEPFSIAPDPRFLFMSQRHREALAHLRYGLRCGGGFVVLTGEVGAGKTTVCRCILEQVPDNCNLAYLFNPELTVAELLDTLCAEFGIVQARDDTQARSTLRSVDALNHYLLRSHAAGQHSVLIIDEAQRLSLALLEQLRLLTNLETNERKLLQIVLIGQPELRQMLARPELVQLAQRVVARFHLGTLSRDETEAYVRHRLAVAGMAGAIPFDRPALRRIHGLSSGVPRRINLLCDRALLGAYAQGKPHIGRATIDQAAREVFGADRSPGARDALSAWSWPIMTGAVVAVAVAALAVVDWAHLGLRAAAAPTAAPLAAAAQAPARGATGVAEATAEPASVATANPTSSGAMGVAQATAEPASVATANPSSSGHMPPAKVASSDTAAPAGPVLGEAEFSALIRHGAIADEALAWRELASGWRTLPAGAAACPALRAQGVLCFKRRGSVALLRELDRPAILPLYLDSNGGSQPRFAVLVGLSASIAELRIGERQILVSLPTLGMSWREEIGVLWQAPPGVRISASGLPISVDPSWLETQLARSQAASAPVETSPDAARLKARIRAFQRAHGLEPDGLVGAMTIMLLQHRGGSDAPRLRH